MTAGYSGTPLPRKLGLKPGMRASAVRPPKHYTKLLGPLDGVRLGSRLSPDLDFIHAFFRRSADLETAFARLKASLAPNGTLWISWPKLSSPLAGDLDGNAVREIGLAHGLVDEDWSGLKFVRRLRDR
jgi:hypothetical protein